MKKETKTIIINHPDLGKLEKSVTFTYDETKYKSLDECIADHEKMETELAAESKMLTDENKEAIEKNELENQKILTDVDLKFKSDLSDYEKTLGDIQAEHEKRIADLQGEYKQKYESVKKPIKVIPKLKEPVLNRVDTKKYEGRGYISKEMAAKEVPIDVISILASATPEQIEILKAVFK